MKNRREGTIQKIHQKDLNYLFYKTGESYKENVQKLKQIDYKGQIEKTNILVGLNPKTSIITSKSNKPNTPIKNKDCQNG